MKSCTFKGVFSPRHVQYHAKTIAIDTYQVIAGDDAPASVLMPADDPEDRCAILDGQWLIAEKLQIGRLLDNGDTVQCSPLALSEGDFVDVGLSFDIALAKAPNGQRKVRVFLCLEHVLQLLPYRRVSEVRNEYYACPYLDRLSFRDSVYQETVLLSLVTTRHGITVNLHRSCDLDYLSAKMCRVH